MNFKKILIEMDACEEAVKWVGRKSLKTSWNTCKRSDWMLWLLDQINYDEIILRRLACKFVRETPLADGRKVWDLLTDERSRQAIVVAEKYCDGKATKEEGAAAGAAWAAARAAGADGAAGAAWAAAGAAGAAWAAWAAQSSIIRDMVSYEDVKKYMEKTK